MKSNSNSHVYPSVLRCAPKKSTACAQHPGLRPRTHTPLVLPHRTGKADNLPHPELLCSPAFLQIPLEELPGNVGVPSLGSKVLNNSLTSGDSLAGCNPSYSGRPQESGSRHACLTSLLPPTLRTGLGKWVGLRGCLLLVSGGLEDSGNSSSKVFRGGEVGGCP